MSLRLTRHPFEFLAKFYSICHLNLLWIKKGAGGSQPRDFPAPSCKSTRVASFRAEISACHINKQNAPGQFDQTSLGALVF